MALFNEVKKYWNENNIILNNTEKWMVENLKIGQRAKFKDGNKYVDVVLDTPKVGGSRRFFVYHDSGKKIEEEILAVKVEWGDPTATIKNHIPSNAASFWARHKCDTKMDPKTAGFWACYAPTLFGKQLGLQSEEPW